MTSLSVVIPARNEEASVGDVLERCLAVLPSCVDDFDVTVVDHGSSDRTGAIAAEYAARHPERVRVVRLPRSGGFGAAFAAAYRAGTKERVLLLHADGQYPPEALPGCMEVLRNSDVALLVRRHKFYGPYRALLSVAYRLIVRACFGLDLRDPGCSKCFRREFLGSALASKGVFGDVERVIRAAKNGAVIGYAQVDSRPRTSGRAHGSSTGVVVETLRDIVAVRRALSRAKA